LGVRPLSSLPGVPSTPAYRSAIPALPPCTTPGFVPPS
jgi:hypothetical protein